MANRELAKLHDRVLQIQDSFWEIQDELDDTHSREIEALLEKLVDKMEETLED